jgi:hypothetical protein
LSACALTDSKDDVEIESCGSQAGRRPCLATCHSFWLVLAVLLSDLRI